MALYLTVDSVHRDTREAVAMLAAAASRLDMVVQADVQAVLVQAWPGDSAKELHEEFVRVRDAKHLRVKIAQLKRREEAA